MVVDEEVQKTDDDEITPPNVENAGTEPEAPKAPEAPVEKDEEEFTDETQTPEAPENTEGEEIKNENEEDDIETLRQNYFEKFGKEVAK